SEERSQRERAEPARPPRSVDARAHDAERAGRDRRNAALARRGDPRRRRPRRGAHLHPGGDVTAAREERRPREENATLVRLAPDGKRLAFAIRGAGIFVAADEGAAACWD